MNQMLCDCFAGEEEQARTNQLHKVTFRFISLLFPMGEEAPENV